MSPPPKAGASQRLRAACAPKLRAAARGGASCGSAGCDSAEQPAAPDRAARARPKRLRLPERQARADRAPAAPAATAGAGDPAKGETFAARCKACHTFEKGGPNRVGPHLFGVVGRPIASVADFTYSDAMKTFAEGGKVWDDATLDAYLADPKGTAPGNKMAFPGVKSEADRANVIAYLKTLAE